MLGWRRRARTGSLRERDRDHYYKVSNNRLGRLSRGDGLFARGDWQGAFECYAYVLLRTSSLDVRTYDELRIEVLEDQEVDSIIAEGYFDKTAYCQAKMGDLVGALETIEAGRSIAMRSNVKLDSLPDGLRREIATIRENLTSLQVQLLQQRRNVVSEFAEIQFIERYARLHLTLYERLYRARSVPCPPPLCP